MKYRAIFDFLNVYSETFVAGGDNSLTAKPWLLEAVPEMHRLSVDDICLKKEGALCAILFLDASPSDSIKGIVKDLQKKFSNMGGDRGADMQFMWLNIKEEIEWVEKIEVPHPGIIFLKHGKRSRYAVHQGDFESESLKKSVESILGGDGKFTNIKGGLPKFSTRKIE